jgi:hypothetical protein
MKVLSTILLLGSLVSMNAFAAKQCTDAAGNVYANGASASGSNGCYRCSGGVWYLSSNLDCSSVKRERLLSAPDLGTAINGPLPLNGLKK